MYVACIVLVLGIFVGAAVPSSSDSDAEGACVGDVVVEATRDGLADGILVYETKY